MEQERVSCLALPQADNALKGHGDVVGLHVGVQGVEGGLEPAVDALPLAAHLAHPAANQQVAILIPLTHHHTTPAS